MRKWLSYKSFLFFCIALLSTLQSHATHIFGIDLFYTYVSGNTYTIHLVVYGDCSGAAFGTLSTAAPVIDIYNGNTSVSSVTLAIQAPDNGVNVTPVCPADSALTTCTSTSYTIPGVKKFTYTGNVTLTGTSTVWRFLFEGVMGSSSAGRSSTITNITSPGSTIIELVDTLNNVPAPPHSSAIFTAIPTPFFCDNVPANYNPGAVPTAGDSIALFLVPGVDATTGSDVNYITPYTAAEPLAVTAGTFSFTSATGQLSFTPDLLQRSLVVYNVEEYRGGVLRGTCQREMTFVVLTCTSTPPTGSISGASAGTITSPTTFNICDNVGAYDFHIDPTDGGGWDITMSVSGLPAGATFNITGNGTTAPIGTFLWNTTGVAPGSYTFYINYQDNGCPLAGIQTIAYTVQVLPVPTESVALISAATCTKKAVFHVTPGGSSSPWTVEAIEGGATVQTITGVTGMITDSLSPGTYTIRTLNGSGCYADTTITIAAPPLPVPTVTTTPPLCPGGATGTATITAAGGTPPYLYAIGSGSFSTVDTFTGLTPGTYVLHIEDSNDCRKDTIITVPNATPILMNIHIQKPLCDTFSNGIVVISAYNSVGPYTYAIGSGAYSTLDTFTGLGATSYTFHVKNANGCIVDTVLSLTDSVSVHGALTIAPILCNLGNGTVTVFATGGSALPYEYAYNTNPFGTSDVFTLPAGAYSFHVHDANGCYWDTTATLAQPSPITITTTITNVLCNGAATGSVTVHATGGTPAYNYNIDGGAYGTSSTLSGLTAGSHVVSVKDANGCVYSDTITITQPSPVVIDSVSMTEPLCNGGSNGSITFYTSGGVSPYTYALGTGPYGTSRTFSALSAGTYTLHVKDANGCTADTIVTLQQPTAIMPSVAITPSLCQTLANGKIATTAAGGTPTYTFAIGRGAYGTSGTFTPLPAGTDTVYIKDAHGCIKDTIVTVTDSLRVYALIAVTPALCHGQASGSVTVTGTGGGSPYTYGIGAGAYGTSDVFTGLAAGTYVLHIKDDNGCKDDTSVTVTQPTTIVPAITTTAPACYGYSNGSITVSASGGTPSYTYALNNSVYAAATTFTGIAAGTDTVFVKDANGCLHDSVVTVQQPTQIAFAGISITNVSCYNGSNGILTVTGAGATPPYMYAANGGAWQAGNTFTGFSAGVVTVQLKDNNGCETDTSVNITQPTQLIITGADTIDPTCVGYKNGSVTVFVTGGTPSYSYSGDNISFGSSDVFTGLPAGTYTFYIKDNNGCTTDTTITLYGLPAILVDSVELTQPLCYGADNGAITIIAGGGVPPFTYQVGNGAKVTAGVFDNLTAGAYIITITDSKNCDKDSTIILPQPDSIAIAANITLNVCVGEEDQGMVSTSVTGGTTPYSYLWNTTPQQTTPSIGGLANGTYTVLVTDAHNCTDSLSSVVDYDNCCTPFIPNAFTPNGDGKDDFFKLYYKGDVYIITFSVYNRFGQQVYTISNTANPDPGWDGRFEGVNCDLGTYYYYAKIICGNKGNHTKELKGDVTLIR